MDGTTVTFAPHHVRVAKEMDSSLSDWTSLAEEDLDYMINCAYELAEVIVLAARDDEIAAWAVGFRERVSEMGYWQALEDQP